MSSYSQEFFSSQGTMSQASTSTAAKPGRKKAHKNNVPRSLIDLVPGDGSSTANTRETDELARSSTNNKRKRRHDEFQEMLNNDNDDEDDVYIHSSPLPAGQKVCHLLPYFMICTKKPFSDHV